MSKKVVQINRIRASGYQGASSSTRAQSWNDSNLGPNSAITSSLTRLRSRSRSAKRNNPWISKGINSLVANEIGKGITPRSLSDSKEDINAYWKHVALNSDPEGILSFYGQQSVMVAARRTSGEVFIRRRIRRHAGAKSPIQFQVIESDYVPETLNRDLPNGNTIRAGIEFNKRNQRVAYWTYINHPLEQGNLDRRVIRIPASEMIHHYMPTRPGQLRGEPDVAQSIVKAYTFDKYDDAELQRKESKSSTMGSITRDPAVFNVAEEDATAEQASMQITPNTVVELLPGEEMDLLEGDNTGSGYADFMRQQLLAIAAGLDLPYELLTGDWKDVNDRLVRAILNEFRRTVEMAQENLMIHQVCRRAWGWALDAGVLSGELHLPSYAKNYEKYQSCEWSPHSWDYTHPLQDVQARVMEIDNGLKSRSRSIDDRGGDAVITDNQRKEDMERERSLGIERAEKEKPKSSNQSDGNRGR